MDPAEASPSFLSRLTSLDENAAISSENRPDPSFISALATQEPSPHPTHLRCRCKLTGIPFMCQNNPRKNRDASCCTRRAFLSHKSAFLHCFCTVICNRSDAHCKDVEEEEEKKQPSSLQPSSLPSAHQQRCGSIHRYISPHYL